MEGNRRAKRVDAYPAPPPRRRRPWAILSAAAIISLTIFFTISNVDEVAKARHRVQDAAKDATSHVRHPNFDYVSDIRHPFRPTAHEPPPQDNSTSGDVSWLDDWKWLNPFSSSTTLDEHQAVLPPPPERPPIYTYHDAEAEKEDDLRVAEAELLLTWGRAWWAKGFKPIILGPGDAMRNPHYELLQAKKLKPAIKNELMRWLAWAHMGTGILANYLVFPMGPYDDAVLSALRTNRHEEKVTRFEALNTGLFSGQKKAIESTLRSILDSPNLESAQNFLETPPSSVLFAVNAKPQSIAFYETSTIQREYKSIATALVSSQAGGMKRLAALINAHLHKAFLQSFREGFAIVAPKPYYTAWLHIAPITLANALNECPGEPSCPPNRPQCGACTPRPIAFPSSYTNNTKRFTIAAVPHPLTFKFLMHQRSSLDVSFVRRNTTRDAYIAQATGDLVKSSWPAHARLPVLKALVADPASDSFANLLLTAERSWEWEDFEYRFGFALSRPDAPSPSPPQTNSATKKKGSKPETPSGPPTLLTFPPPVSPGDPPKALDALFQATIRKPRAPPLTEELESQAGYLKAAREWVGRDAGQKRKRRRKGLWRHDGEEVNMREVVEAWNLADTEAWRFVRAFAERSRMERVWWIEEERGFERRDRKRGWW